MSQVCEESGTDLAQILKKNQKKKEKQAGSGQVQAGATIRLVPTSVRFAELTAR